MLNATPRKIKKIGTIILTPTVVLLGFVWSYLEKVLPITTKQELPTIYLVQIAISGIIIIVALLAFSIFLLVFIVKESFKHQANAQPNEIKKADIKDNLQSQDKHKPLDEIAIKILLLLWKRPNLTENTISELLKTDLEAIKYHLHKLSSFKMVSTAIHGDYPQYLVWHLDQEGRRYLIDNKLIS